MEKIKKNKIIEFGKLSKKEQKKLNNLKRQDWGGLNPVTRMPEKPKAYNRAKEKARQQKDF